MRFTPQFLDEIRARLPVSQVVARKVALKKAGREYRGLSPFKVEKTPSFFVNDHKGFYHCFATGEHGDIFTFMMKTEGLSFPEAVERLAEEAGVPLPKPDVRSVEREDQRNIFTFLMKPGGLSSPGAAERLAGEAGFPLPKPAVRSVEREAQRPRLYGLLEAAAQFFETQLAGPAGTEARRYLREKRGL